MASKSKRMKYAYKLEVTSSEEESCEDTDYKSDEKNRLSQIRSTRKPKCFTKNALLARENRLRKKLYVSQLENDVSSLRHENKKLSSVVDNQSHLIAELRKETKYLKSVIANSRDISKLIRNINHSSGMSVSSSLDETLSLKNIYIPKLKQPVSRKTAHPWEENDLFDKPFSNYPTPDSIYLSSPDQEDLGIEIFKDISLDLPNMPEDQLLNTFTPDEEKPAVTFEEHNYTLTESIEDENLEDVGVCLHVSKHHVSLEFCSTCSEKAHQSRHA